MGCNCYEVQRPKQMYLSRTCNGGNCIPVKVKVTKQVCKLVENKIKKYTYDCQESKRLNVLINEPQTGRQGANTKEVYFPRELGIF